MQDGGTKKRAPALAFFRVNCYTGEKGGDGVKVYLADCAKLTERELSAYLAALPPGRRAYAARFKKETDRATAVIGFLLVSRMLRDADPGFVPTDWAIGEHGKPYLPGSDLHFSLSHADGLCAAVLSNRPIGLDVELIRPLRQALIPRFCTPDEIERCKADPDLAVKIWTQREARAKENGRGIGQKLTVLPTAGTTSLKVKSGGRAFWLSFTAEEPAETVVLSPAELL